MNDQSGWTEAHQKAFVEADAAFVIEDEGRVNDILALTDFPDAAATIRKRARLRLVRAVVEAVATRWIPVGERLPEPGIRVLGWHESAEFPVVVWLDIIESCSRWAGVCDGLIFAAITHWQELPPGPRVKP